MHLELTSRCTLKCPACPRTVISDRIGFFPKIDLDLDEFSKFIDCDAGKQIDNFLLEGNHGDPIYYPQLLKFIDQFRANKTFTIVTNGSFRDEDFWHNIGSSLTDRDWVIFSIDGLPETNHLYRKNSDWKSIHLGLTVLKKYPVNVGWKTIIFNHNYQQLDQIKSLAQEYNAHFVSETTSRFGDESLRPPESLVENFREYNKQSTELIKQIYPQCTNHQKEYISADGFYWPCCWISSAFTLYKSELWKNREQWRIKNHTLDQLRNCQTLWLNNMQDNPDTVCKMMCKPGNPVFPVNHGVELVDQK